MGKVSSVEVDGVDDGVSGLAGFVSDPGGGDMVGPGQEDDGTLGVLESFVDFGAPVRAGGNVLRHPRFGAAEHFAEQLGECLRDGPAQTARETQEHACLYGTTLGVGLRHG